MTARVEVDGLAEARRALDDAADELVDLDDVAGPAAADRILVAATWGAPRRTGVLAASGYVDATGGAPAVVFGARYAPPVHSGVPSRGMPGQPFLDDAARRQTEAVTTIYTREVERIARRAE